MTNSAQISGQPSAAFDALAETYDDLFTNSWIGRAQRESVWREMDRQFKPGHRILEVNCGTGVDALHLAKRGIRIVACDASAEMISVAQRRLEREGLGASVDFQVLPTERIRELESVSLFDGALSNFAGLNCVEDLAEVGAGMSALLKPGAKFVACVFGRWCLWEILWYLTHGKPSKALRRLSPQAAVELTEDERLRVHYPSVRKLKRAFKPHFHLEQWKGIGVAVPPSYLEFFARNHRRALRAAHLLDHGISRIAIVRGLADHLLLTFERT